MTLFGAARLRAAIAEKRVLALETAERLQQVPGLSLMAPPELSLFAFHVTWPGSNVTERNDATRELIDRVRDRGQVMMTGCTVDGQFLARICILSFRTRRPQVDLCVTQIAEETASILAAHNPR